VPDHPDRRRPARANRADRLVRPRPRGAVSTITLAAGDGDQPSVVMAYGAQPIGQPVAIGGPFVMNTKTEITQAFSDFHSGQFGDIPRQARLKYR
jgi:quercetin 2,3-dioxygenase